jgi:hypothetical protein
VDLHGVFMARQVLAAKHHTGVTREIDFVLGGAERQTLTLLNVADKVRNAVDVNGVRLVTGQT